MLKFVTATIFYLYMDLITPVPEQLPFLRVLRVFLWVLFMVG